MTPADHIHAAIKAFDLAEHHMRQVEMPGATIAVDHADRGRLHAHATLRDLAREGKSDR